MNATEDETTNVVGLSTPESSRKADEQVHVGDTDATLIEDDGDTESDNEEVARNVPCKNCQHKRCVLDRRIANVVKVVVRECERVTEAADQFGDAMGELVEGVVSSMEHVDTELNAVNAAVVNLQAKVNLANEAKSWLESDIDGLRAEIQRPIHTQSGIQLGAHPVTRRKRKMTNDGSPIPEAVVNGGSGSVAKGHGRKMSKISNGLPSRHATPSQGIQE